MSSILKVDTIQDQSGNNIINESADTITIGASGDTVNIVGTLQNGGTNFLQEITMADQWRITADTNSGTDGDITTNWERADDPTWSGIGTGLTESSGIFSFSQTGIYLITANFNVTMRSDGGAGVQGSTTSDDSAYAADGRGYAGDVNGSTDVYGMASFQFLFDVTNISTHKMKFSTTSFAANTVIKGRTDINQSGFIVLRLGDT